MTQPATQKTVLQLCHSYKMPFLDVARQYASLFINSDYKVITVYLTGKKDEDVIKKSASDEVIFLEYSSRDIRGMKIKQIKQLKHLHRHYDFDFAIAHRYKAIYILQFVKGLPVVGINHAFNVYRNPVRRWFMTFNQKDLYLLGVSNAIRDYTREQLPRFPQQHIQTSYNHLDSDKICDAQLSREKAREALGIQPDQYIFANVGRLHPDKDQKTLIDGFAAIVKDLPNANLIILGKGRLESALKEQIQALNLENRVFLLGVIPDAVKYFKAFDCFVLSSDYEPFGMVLLEAILADIPVIATDAGGAKEIIADNEALFDVGDSHHLAKLMFNTYHMDTATLITKCQNNADHLDTNFTDLAVRKAFWNLDFIQALTQRNLA